MTGQHRTTIQDILGPLNEVEHKNAPEELYYAGDRQAADSGC